MRAKQFGKQAIHLGGERVLGAVARSVQSPDLAPVASGAKGVQHGQHRSRADARADQHDWTNRGEPAPPGRLRRAGAGRPPITEREPGLVQALLALVEGATRGDPESPLLWTSRSVAKLTAALREQGFDVHESTVRRLLKALGFSLQANRKTHEGSDHPDRDAQFEHIAQTSAQALADGQPVISVDCKKTEQIGEYKNAGRELAPTGRPILVNTHDFIDQELGKAIPYGIYDVGQNEGWVSVGVSAETAQLAVASIQAWWQQLGKPRYPQATTLTVTADCGGANGYRTRRWKTELQRLTDQTGLGIRVLHYPRHLEVEQDRAPVVLLHLDQLARQAAGQPPSRDRPDRLDHDHHRTEGLRAP